MAMRDRRASAPSLALLVLALALAASCRRSASDQPVLPPDRLANAIEDVRVEKKEAPKTPPKRLAFLQPRDLASVGGEILCILRQHDRTVLVAGAARALARVDGRPTILALSGPMDASAAFFSAPRVTISIGRHAPVARDADVPGIAWPVGVTVGGLRDLEAEKIDATWSCRAAQARG
jgi:hypothetical protein